MTKPTIGRIVHYQTDGRGGLKYPLPAVIVRTQDTTDPDGPLPLLPDEQHVDLHVLSVAGASYGEDAVPFDPDGSPRSWRWPERTA